MGILYKLKQNSIKDSKVNGKWFAHVANTGTMTYDELCQHIAEHGSPFTDDICLGVGRKLLRCIHEQLLEGKKVQFGDLGTFYLALTSKGTDTVSEFNASEHITGLFLRFTPNRSEKWALTSKRMRAKARFGDIGDLANKPAMDAEEEERQEQEGGIEP